MDQTIQVLEKKMAQGSAKAALELAEGYKWGLFGQVNFRKAGQIYRLLAKSRNPSLSSQGYYNLGLLYYHGFLGDPEHPEVDKAFEFFVKSALTYPNRGALAHLADMYRYGQAVERNEGVALTLYSQASSRAS